MDDRQGYRRIARRWYHHTAGRLVDALVDMAWRPSRWGTPLTYTPGHPSHTAMWSEGAQRWVYWT